MKSAIVLSLASLALGHVLENRNCPGNNCNRQVTGTRAGLPAVSARSSDCSAFLAVTVTPTTTRTRTVTQYTKVAEATTSDDACSPVTVTVNGGVAARQATSTGKAVPTWASNCADGAAFGDACSCLGVTAGPTVTGRAPRVTVTTTLPATSCEASAIAAVPTCALECFEALYPKYECTGFTDFDCQCKVFETLGTEVTPCVVEKCSHADVELIFPAAQNGCACYSTSLGLSAPTPTAV